jgi:multidrug efflux pump subunit AcrA (membrane-fusion protein)
MRASYCIRFCSATIGLIGTCGLLSGCPQEQSQPPKTEPVLPVHVEVAKPVDQAARYTYAGEISPRIETAMSFRIGGKMLGRSVEVGSQVKPGTEIARLDPQDTRLETDAMSSQLQAA